MIEGFRPLRTLREGIALAAWRAGGGPPLLLLHGHPQTHVIWHRVAPALAQRFDVLALDLRGYGDSCRPLPDPDHVRHSKREMALDVLHWMDELGVASARVLAHDRGDRADRVDGQALPCGHYIAEELPQVLLDEVLAFMTGD